MTTWARPGARCVCITTAWEFVVRFGYERFHPDVDVHLWEKLIIQRVELSMDGSSLLLVFEGKDQRCGYSVNFFRPIVDRPEAEDIAMFKSLLRPADPIELADAYERSFADVEEALNRFDLP